MCVLLPSGPTLSNALFPPSGNNPLPLEEAAQVIDIEFQRAGLSLHDSIAQQIRELNLSGDNSVISAFLAGNSAAMPPDELVAGSDGQPESIPPRALLVQVLDRANLQRALKQVRRNQGAPGIDGMTVDELPEYLISA